MIYLELDDLLHIARRILPSVELRDVGLLQSAAARPQSSAFGEDAYPALHAKAAALLHSIARNHALVDGNKRLALAGVLAFDGLNGERLTLTNDEAYELVVAVAAGEVTDVDVIATRLEGNSEPRVIRESVDGLIADSPPS
jgi:death-on-curing protein